MGFGDEKTFAKLREAEKGTLVETTSVGRDVTYYPKSSRVHWRVEHLQVHRSFARREEGETSPPTWTTTVTGVARLVSDHDISIIGEPSNKTSTVRFSLRPDNSADLTKIDTEEAGGFRFWQPHGKAFLGFNRGDWETHSDDTWWLECYLHEVTLAPVIDAIGDASLSKLEVSVVLPNLYTSQSPAIPFVEKEHLFLRPDKRDNSIDHPEMASGYVTDMIMALWGFATHREDSEDVTDAPAHPAKPLSSDSMDAARVVATNVESLRRTLKWVGGLISSALLLLLFK